MWFRFIAPANKRLVLFVDDINLPTKEQYGAQPPLELLRLLLDRRGVYDRKTLQWKAIHGINMVSACGPPGGGRQEMPARLTRRFVMLNVPHPSELCIKGIYSAILGGFLDKHFTPGRVGCMATAHAIKL